MTSRRAFLHHSTLCLAGFSTGRLLAADPNASPLLRAGLMTDLDLVSDALYGRTPAPRA